MSHGAFLPNLGFSVPCRALHGSSTADTRVICVDGEQGQVEHSIKPQKKGLPNPNPSVGTSSLPIKTSGYKHIRATLKILYFYLTAGI